MKKIVYTLLFVIWYGFSLLPLWFLYRVADLLYFPLYYLIRYRRRTVRKNLVDSFPEKSLKEIVCIEKRYYVFFCDYVVETVKFFSMKEETIRKRMRFEGVEEIKELMSQGKSCSLYLGHYCNWEWITSIPFHIGKSGICGQIYHPLENKNIDKLFLYMRERCGAFSIAMDDTLRVIMEWKKAGKASIVGYISDQVPGYNNIHYFADFLNHDTPVFTGAERMARIMDTAVYYGDIYRPKRGYYVIRLVKIAESIQDKPTFFATKRYFELLEESIRRAPEYWLWSHNRWKRTREEFNHLYSEEERRRRLNRL